MSNFCLSFVSEMSQNRCNKHPVWSFRGSDTGRFPHWLSHRLKRQEYRWGEASRRAAPGGPRLSRPKWQGPRVADCTNWKRRHLGGASTSRRPPPHYVKSGGSARCVFAADNPLPAHKRFPETNCLMSNHPAFRGGRPRSTASRTKGLPAPPNITVKKKCPR